MCRHIQPGAATVNPIGLCLPFPAEGVADGIPDGFGEKRSHSVAGTREKQPWDEILVV